MESIAGGRGAAPPSTIAPAGAPAVPQLHAARFAGGTRLFASVGATFRTHAAVTRSLVALLAYAALAVLVFGRGVLLHPSEAVVGSGQSAAFAGRDQGAFVWFLAWGAHLLAHPQNPFLTHEVYAPGGYNLAWAASIPGPALLLACLTALLGAVPVFNLMALLAPACSAWTAFLLCARVGHRHAPAALAGLLFGFSSYEATQTVNHLNLALVALLPLAPLLAFERSAGTITTRRYVSLLGVLAAAQLWTSTELFAGMVVFGALALAIALVVGRPDDRRALRRLSAETLAALAVAAALGAPLLLAAAGPDPVASHSTVDAGADAANFLVPTRVTWLHDVPTIAASRLLGGNLTERPDYLGPLLLVLLAALSLRWRRSRLTRGVLLFTGMAAVLSLGGRLIVLGKTTGVTLPWALVGQIPPLRYALPDRFAVFMWLGAAVAVTLFLSSSRRAGARWLLAVAACVSVFPNATGFAWSTRLDAPPLLASPSLARYVPHDSTVLALPFGMDGDSMLWQVESGFAFRLAGGYVSWALPAQYRGLTIIHELVGRRPGGQLRRRLCSFLAMTHARTILLRTGAAGDWRATLATLDVVPLRRGGFEIYRLSAGDACATAGRG